MSRSAKACAAAASGRLRLAGPRACRSTGMDLSGRSILASGKPLKSAPGGRSRSVTLSAARSRLTHVRREGPIVTPVTAIGTIVIRMLSVHLMNFAATPMRRDSSRGRPSSAMARTSRASNWYVLATLNTTLPCACCTRARVFETLHVTHVAQRLPWPASEPWPCRRSTTCSKIRQMT